MKKTFRKGVFFFTLKFTNKEIIINLKYLYFFKVLISDFIIKQ